MKKEKDFGPEAAWVRVEDRLPEKEKRVLVFSIAPKYGGGELHRTCIAVYIPFKEVPESEFMAEDFYGEGDYDEEKDEYFTPMGFYESNWYSEISYKISDKVTHWMPLPKSPIELPNDAESDIRTHLINFYKMLEREGKFPNSAGWSDFWTDKYFQSLTKS